MNTLSDNSYPSGNLAVIVIRERKWFICIVQEDKHTNAEIQALFESNGRSTCYYPHGSVWYVCVNRSIFSVHCTFYISKVIKCIFSSTQKLKGRYSIEEIWSVGRASVFYRLVNVIGKKQSFRDTAVCAKLMQHPLVPWKFFLWREEALAQRCSGQN